MSTAAAIAAAAPASSGLGGQRKPNRRRRRDVGGHDLVEQRREACQGLVLAPAHVALLDVLLHRITLGGIECAQHVAANEIAVSVAAAHCASD
jgi:hypothetical protein